MTATMTKTKTKTKTIARIRFALTSPSWGGIEDARMRAICKIKASGNGSGNGSGNSMGIIDWLDRQPESTVENVWEHFKLQRHFDNAVVNMHRKQSNYYHLRDLYVEACK